MKVRLKYSNEIILHEAIQDESAKLCSFLMHKCTIFSPRKYSNKPVIIPLVLVHAHYGKILHVGMDSGQI